ncbi:MAG TPA: hypothetical protein VEJ87_03725, partial [Acidimicrobiales bacterium]|nr:hypothetical protein [Acidimicrobiales bacterium]
DDLEAFDLYSCFPSSIEVARDTLAIDVDDDRPLTLTGGLPYHGGPGSNYVTHALANTLQRLRSGGGPVLVHGNGYYLTKHALGVYTNRTNKRTTEPDGDLQKQIDALTAPIPVLAPEDLTRTATATVAAYTVPFGRDGSHEAAIALISATDGPDEDRQATSGQTIHSVVRCGEKLTSDLLDGDGVGSTVLLEKEDGGVVATAG